LAEAGKKRTTQVGLGSWIPPRASFPDLLVVPGLLLLFVLAARVPVMTPDVWWHLATGRLVAQEGIPESDPFSYTLAGVPWTAHEWASDLALYGVYASAGLLGIVMLRAALLVAAFGMATAAARLQAGPMQALAVLVPAAWASQRNWLDRPQLVTYLFAAILLWVLERQRLRPTRWVWALPPLFALWVNLHGGFFLGLGLLAVWALAELWAARATPSAARPLVLVTCASLIATLLNPHGWEGAIYPLRYVGAGLGASLQEEGAGRLDSVYAWLHFGLVTSTLVLFLWRRKVPLAHVLLVCILGWISMPRIAGVALPFAAERHAPLFLLVGTPILAWQIAAACGNRRVRVPDSKLLRRLGIAAGALASVWLLARLPRDPSPEARLLPGRYPQAAVSWYQSHPIPGPLINPYRWGGYLAFALYPGTKVWIDSRGDLYGSERLREYEILHRASPGSDAAIAAVLARYDANVIVWPLLTLDFGALQVHPFSEYLLRSGGWRLVFYDRPDAAHPEHPSAVSAVFLREHPRNAALLARYAPVRLPAGLPRGTGQSRANGR